MLHVQNWILCALLVIGPHTLWGTTICLNMIVKNERDVITRCLESTLPIIDYWVICDTGSTDGTQQIIIDFMREHNVPGELHERPWVDFAHNRNEAMQLAKGKGDYLMFVDADEYLEYTDDFALSNLDKDYYYFTLTWPGSQWKKISLINNHHQDWQWVGVLHEVICPPSHYTFGTIENMHNIYTVDGARSKDPKKYEKDTEILEKALQDDPNNKRYLFYLARSYAYANNKQKAIELYKKRAELGFDGDIEAYYSALQMGLLQEECNMPSEDIINSFRMAISFCRLRAEPYYHLARHYRTIGDNQKCYLIAQIAKTLPLPKDSFFIDEWIYDHGILMELSVSAYWLGKYKECQEASLALLQKPELPASYRECAEANLGFANAKLLEEVCQMATSSS